MTYAETLDYLYSTLPMFSRMGSAAFKKDLTNIRALCAHLGNPQNTFKSVHVGGTNGKGSVSHMLAAILQKAGYKTGLYTSPHLYDFRERIRTNGQMISEDFVVSFTDEIKELAEQVQPSFFEITVAMAFQYFAQQRVDVAVIEVGLGGRLDSTNIIQPELSIITNIGWDHMNMLGNTLEAIAAEKAGIVKTGIPLVVGERLAETEPVFEKAAAEKKAKLVWAEERFQIVSTKMFSDRLAVDFAGKEKNLIFVTTDLAGLYQTRNLRTVLTAVSVLKQMDWKLDDDTVLTALTAVKKTTGLRGRWDLVHRNPDIVLDVAHNKEGIQQLLAHLSQLQFGKLHFVFGMVKDKDADSVLALLPATAHYYFTQAQIPRALPADDLAVQASRFQLQGSSYTDVNDALREALLHAAADDLVVVCGSIFVVAEVRTADLAMKRKD